MGGVGLIV